MFHGYNIRKSPAPNMIAVTTYYNEILLASQVSFFIYLLLFHG